MRMRKGQFLFVTAPECSLRVRVEEKTEGNPLIEESSEKEPLSLKWKVFTSGSF